MPTIGLDCHVILNHPEVNSGADYGFLTPDDDSIRAEGVQFKREVVSDSTGFTDPTTGTRLWVYFDILLADGAVNPEGSIRTASRAQEYTLLQEYLSKPSNISLTSVVGTLLNLGSLGWSADERHLPQHSIVKCQLNNVGYYFPPVDPELLVLSTWDGSLTWGTAYWR